MTLSKIESPIKNGNQVTGYEYYWAHDPNDLNASDASVIGEVDEEDLEADPWQALASFTGPDSSITTLREFFEFHEFLTKEHGYKCEIAREVCLKIAEDQGLELMDAK